MRLNGLRRQEISDRRLQQQESYNHRHERISVREPEFAFVLLLSEEKVIDGLYDLIGGRQTVWAATESFYKRVYADDTLRPFFKTTDMVQLTARQSMFIFMLLGGRVVYTGKDVHAAHAHAHEEGLNDGHFDRFLMHFREALKEVGVKADKVEKVTKLLETRRNALLNP